MQQRLLGNTCAGCHGTNGASAGEAPIIGGLSKDYLLSTMKAYRDNQRHATIMGLFAKGYDDTQLAQIAEYFANQEWVTPAQDTDPALVERGGKLHASAGCVGCHGAQGVSPMPNVPRLAGQYAYYLETQLKYFADAETTIPPGAMVMRSMLAGMSAEDRQALAHFYAAQNPEQEK